MKISIITATYNSEQNIKDCLQSVARQSYENVEHIIIDGNSSDKTLQIVKSFPSVTNYISEQDRGIYDALNKGIKLASGDVIGFVHSDDMLASEDILQLIAEQFEQTNANGIFGDLIFINNKNKTVRNWQSKVFKRKNIKNGWMPPHPTLFLKKEVYQKCGLFDISFTCAGDYDFMLRVMRDKDINLKYLPKIITRMRIGGVSTGNFKQLIMKSKEDIRALRNNNIRFPWLVVATKILRKVPQLSSKWVVRA